MPAEAMVEAILFLAEQREIAEVSEARHAEIRRKDAERKRNSKGNPVEILALAPVVDNISKPSLLVEVSKKDSPPSPSKPLSSDPEGFPEFWAVYPKRAGTADRKPAVKAFGPALKRIDLVTLLWAAGRYAADCKAAGKIGTEYVKQARTWLNADGWAEYGPIKTKEEIIEVLVLFETPAWAEWKKVKPGIVARDIRCPDGQVRRGRYFTSEFPPQEQAA